MKRLAIWGALAVFWPIPWGLVLFFIEEVFLDISLQPGELTGSQVVAFLGMLWIFYASIIWLSSMLILFLWQRYKKKNGRTKAP